MPPADAPNPGVVEVLLERLTAFSDRIQVKGEYKAGIPPWASVVNYGH